MRLHEWMRFGCFALCTVLTVALGNGCSANKDAAPAPKPSPTKTAAPKGETPKAELPKPVDRTKAIPPDEIPPPPLKKGEGKFRPESAKVEKSTKSIPKDGGPKAAPSIAIEPRDAKATGPSSSPLTVRQGDGAYEIVTVFYGTDRAPARTRPPYSQLVSFFDSRDVLAGVSIGLIGVILVSLFYGGPGALRRLKAGALGIAIVALGTCGFLAFRGVWQNLYGEFVYGNLPGDLAYGTAEVSIPKIHQKGRTEAPDPLKGEWNWDPEKHVALLSVTPTPQDAFAAKMRSYLASRDKGEREVLLFVHGYNVTFRDAARRTAQMSKDIEFPGVPAFFSWPSRGELTMGAYGSDAELADGPIVRGHLVDFLTTVAEESHADRIFVVAHSMGNRVLTNALADLASLPRFAGKTPFREVLLTAPDLKRSTFEGLYSKVRKTTQNLTLYASQRDVALWLAAPFADRELRLGTPEQRLGDCSKGSICILPGMESVDVSDIESDLFGHWYYAENLHVLTDIKAVIRRARLEDRESWDWLSRIKTDAGEAYWHFRRGGQR